MQANIFHGSLLIATVTEMTALGFVTGAVPAQAAPACSQYAFNGQQFLIQGANMGEVVVNSGTGTTLVGDASTFGKDGRAVHGFVQGGSIQGRDINFSISWIEPSDTVWSFKGTVSDDGLVHRGIMHGPGFMGLWDSTSPLACNDPVVATKPLPDNNITPPVPATTRVPGPVTAP